MVEEIMDKESGFIVLNEPGAISPAVKQGLTKCPGFTDPTGADLHVDLIPEMGGKVIPGGLP
jgi:hypothetical protein